MLTQNILIGARDYLLRYGTILNPSSFETELPGDNAKNPRMWEFARFNSIVSSDTHVEIDLGDARSCSVFACLKHNMGNRAKWRVRMASSQANLTAAPIYDSGVLDMLEVGVAENDFEWGENGGYEESDGLKRQAFHTPTSAVTARYIRFDFDDSLDVGSRPDNYVQLARLWISNSYQPSLNVVYGAEVFVDDNTNSSESESGVEHFAPLVVKQRRLVAGFNDLPSRELMQSIFGSLFAQGGVTKELVVLLRPMDPESYIFEAIHGHLSSTDSGKHVYHGRMTTSLQVKENV